jgi:glyoxylase-like metal-dependent hydrolase (beta-lactamase superfamily II)
MVAVMLRRFILTFVCAWGLTGTAALGQQRENTTYSVRVDQVVPGVYHLGSGEYFATAVVQGDSIVLIDLPEPAARAQVMLDSLRARFPRTPVRLIVVSHHHTDHMAGLSSTFSAGIPVIAHQAAVQLVRRFDLADGAEIPSSRNVRGVDRILVLGTGTTALQLHAVANTHSSATLLAYLPAHRVLIAPDLAEPGNWELERSALVRHVRELSLNVSQVVPGHTRVRPWSDFDPRFTRESAMIELRRSLAALGGEQALRAITATDATVWHTRYGLRSGQWPEAPPASMQLVGREIRDFGNGRYVFSGERRTIDGANPFRVIVTQREAYEQFFHYKVPYDPDSIRARARESMLSPERVLLTALTSDCRQDEPALRSVRGRTAMALRCITRDSGTFHLRIDSVTARPLEVEMQVASRMYDRENIQTAFADFRRVTGPAGAVLLPHIIETRIGGQVLSRSTYGRKSIIGAPHDSLFGDGRDTRATQERVLVRTNPITPRVLYFDVDSIYFSLAVVQDSGIVLIDPPDSERRTRALLDTLRRRFPAVPIRLVVATHHHADHLTGLPLVLERGIPVAAHPASAARVRVIANSARSREPIRIGDVRVVADSLVLQAGSPEETRIYAESFDEAITHLVAYLPGLQLLFVADVAEGGNSEDVRALARRRGLVVQRIATSHTGLQRF